LFEGHEDLLPLAEVSEEQVQRSRHERRVIVHGQVQQDPQECTTAVVIQVQRSVLLTTKSLEQKRHQLQSRFLLKSFYL